LKILRVSRSFTSTGFLTFGLATESEGGERQQESCQEEKEKETHTEKGAQPQKEEEGCSSCEQ